MGRVAAQAVLFVALSVSPLLALRLPLVPPALPRRVLPTATGVRTMRCSEAAREIPIIAPKSLERMTPLEFAEVHDHCAAAPAILTDVWGHGDVGRSGWCEAVVEKLATTEVEFQLQTPTHSELLFGKFEQFLDCVFESTQDGAFFLFDEQILVDPSLSHLRAQVALPKTYFLQNLFDTFPEDLRPKDSCLVVGGEGAHSTLHADPFDWMGTNYCLEGSKLWLFIAPDELVASAIDAYRVEPNAWADEDDCEGSLNAQRPEIAAGWQSDMNIYAAERLSDDWSSSEDLGQMDPAQRLEALDGILRAAAQRVPLSAAASRIEGARLLLALQREGDLVLIPPGWWHQTLHLEPSIAVASQYTNTRNIHSVLNHIIDWCGLDLAQYPPFTGTSDPSAISTAIDATLARARNALRKPTA